MLRKEITKGKNMDEVKAWLSALVQGIVMKPEEVTVDAKKDDMGILFTVHVDPSDSGKVLGRDGKTAKAIRTLLYSIGYKNEMRASLKFDVPEAPPAR